MRSTAPIHVRDLGRGVDYAKTAAAMRQFTLSRDAQSNDEIWLCEHDSVYTLGQAGKAEHVLNRGKIPLLQSDRGGQVTWHGPGQLILYALIDLRRRGFGVRTLVTRLEQSVISVLAAHDIRAASRADAPGVYVAGAKIAALGLRVRNARSYHGLSVNIENALEPFDGINPCGYRGLEVTSFRRLGIDVPFEALKQELCNTLIAELSQPPDVEAG